ncbi:sigma-70 family RNA polymerase sigma factor [Aquiflexum sp. LQ15W]|uniref:RNA polymerase sigma factor n=1 Tax=Cognataquiflexum nitidum TaxID=2922272 RepID=UPI001F1318B7|nr:sigma-70 family RNA polymerase sigma factor [Cognataquiflexum nitidum]MCH6200717.1 sigma-70 family RNA polymerase sigma factor [Cognataquiflexum nitidum]
MYNISTSNNQSDIALIKDALSGSKTALGHLLKQHYNFIYNVALRFVLNPEDAQDLTQEAIIKVITKLSQFNQQSEFRTWLYRIVFNHFLNTKRQKMEYAVVSFDEYELALDSIPNQELSAFEEKELAEKVEDAKIGCMVGMLLCLNREQRLVYILGEIFEIESKTDAFLLGMSAENFRQLLSRGRKDLYHFMNNKCGLINTRNPCRCPKKTKGFIQAGWVNENNLQFNNHFLKRVAELAILKSNQYDDLIEEKYGALYKDHPYYDRDKSNELLKKLTEDSDLKDIFNL